MIRRVLTGLLAVALSLVLGVSQAAENPKVRLTTSMGAIVIELYPEKAPHSVENFLEYVQDGYYDGTIFHRVMSSFMIQGGGFTVDMQKKQTRDPIPNESKNGLSNGRGTIAMARTNDPHSGTAQFFINVVDNDTLDHGAQGANAWGYAVFGKVVDGMGVIDEIRAVRTGSFGSYRNVPATPVVVESATIEQAMEQN